MPRKHEAEPAQRGPELLVYGTDPSRGVLIGFGVFVTVIALIPTTIVVTQWLAWHPGDPELHTAPESAFFGAALALWGVLVATRNDRVTVDVPARTLTWTMFAFGLAYRTVTWSFADVTGVEIFQYNGLRPQGCSAFASGPRGKRALFTYFHGKYAAPRELHETARLLGIKVSRN